MGPPEFREQVSAVFNEVVEDVSPVLTSIKMKFKNGMKQIPIGGDRTLGDVLFPESKEEAEAKKAEEERKKAEEAAKRKAEEEEVAKKKKKKKKKKVLALIPLL